MITPTNFSVTTISPVGYEVAEGRNAIVEEALAANIDWIFFVDHDVLVPTGVLMWVRRHMLRNKYPFLSGFYYTKGSCPEPLIYRGVSRKENKEGQGPYYGWKPGEKIWVSGTGFGCTLVHTSLFKADKAPWFVSPRQGNDYSFRSGTEDLYWCGKVIDNGLIEKAGWEVEDPLNPFLVDTGMLCGHIDTQSGKVYPWAAPDREWEDLHLEAYEQTKKLENAGKKKTVSNSRKR